MITLQRVIELPARPAAVWETLWDVATVARCIPGCGPVETVEDRTRYRAQVTDRIGPFKVTVPLELVVESAEPGRRLRMRAAGRDTLLGSPVRVALGVGLEATAEGTRLTLDGHGEVGGKLAGLGSGVLQRHTRDLLDEFAANLARVLGA
jgi:carbon monoxide dehydrogenase subunit G